MAEQNKTSIIKVEGDIQRSETQLRINSKQAPRNVIEGTDDSDILFGTPGNDDIFAKGGDDTIIGTLGDDSINGGDGFDTLDYTKLGQKITLLPQGLIGNGSSQGSQIQSIERIIGASKKDNTIDGSGTKDSPVFFTIDLSDNLLVVENIPRLGSVKFVVENFVNVEATENSDSITGNNRNNKLSGNGGDDNLIGKFGNDTLIGGSGNDTLTGADPSRKDTVGAEKDVLTGGNGGDKFVLGNELGSFYDDFGNNDFAKITDFSFGDQINLGSGEKYNIQRTKQGFNIFVVEDSVNDLIGRITFGTSITSTMNSSMRSESGALMTSNSEMIVDLNDISESSTIKFDEQTGFNVVS